jgi:hypothetical protein
MTWFGHCITNVTGALKALPTASGNVIIEHGRVGADLQQAQSRSS